MSSTTETFWDIDGVSLQTYAWNITTLGGDRMAPPKVRGDNLTIPYRPGTLWVPKVVDSRVVTLQMWVIGSDEDGNISNTESSRRMFDSNWRKLRNLLWRPGEQFVLTKRFWVPTADLQAAGINTTALPKDGSFALYDAVTRASFASGLSPDMGGPARAAFTVDILLSDPYFYSAPITVPFSMQSGGVNPGPSRTFTVLGDVRTTDIRFDLTGPLDAARFTNTGSDPDLWMSYNTSVADGDSAFITVKNFRAQHTQAALPYTSSGYVNHFGDRFWFYLDPGLQTVGLSAQAGTGVASLTYRPAWL